MSDRRVTVDDLGAWLIKGNADAVDLTARFVAPPQPGPPGEAWTAPLDLTILDEPLRVRREVLRADPRLAGAEVLRQPQAANPSYLTVAQFEALRGYLPRDGPA
ncbi:hypothetical protein ACIODS_18710 [Micromonospora chalcea]|uniref:hypothetical protein n=1 Tax=Micromonospora chalcea TaxID=1874 RepID=UPI0037F6AA99